MDEAATRSAITIGPIYLGENL
ncbi:hypothetical protein MPL3365_30292 [Mesorhizobium plurifarium]|uniref:Uncharacterized protein n=1 Tax=Mesorhizobium plurifarium TaxID=69974 RepID=A0A090GV43_MESPL|nr:hypothetical protein MPL3365_30292 [Mesorhizobium plurifarium]